MKKTIYIAISVAFASLTLSSCDKPNELTPKTETITEDYLLPQGSLLTDSERQEITARITEYYDAIND